ncbi:MAG: sulfite exporter TauE/SafE family protein, partial [Acidobacteriota bacterium]
MFDIFFSSLILMSHHNKKKLKFQIHGMHCASCEVLIERQFKKVKGVEQVKVNHATGKAEVQYSKTPDLQTLQDMVKEHGYTVSSWADRHHVAQQLKQQKSKRDYIELGAVLLILVAGYLILRQFDLVPKIGITDNMSYGFIFAIGLVAAMSTCLAVTGGLLVAVAAKYNEMHPHLTGVQKLKPHLFFNVGRIVGYTAFGAAIGGLGSVLTISPRVNGLITIAASLVMIILGFQLLHLFPGLKRFQPKLPKFLAHKIHDATSNAHHPTAPFFLGASTFFLPCGFTQALQLYVLSQGDWKVGALTMLAFSLGTLPALMSLSALSSFVKGAFQRYFLKFAGTLVIMLGVFNVNNGLTLAGSSVNLGSFFERPSTAAVQTANDANVQLVDGKQVVRMKVAGLS